MRIKYIVPFAFGDDAVARRAAQVPRDALEPDTQVECVAVRNHPTDLTSYYEAAILDMYVAEAGLAAEDEGYDAVLMDTVSDSGLRALRSRLRIPVLGPGLVAYAVAAMLGRRFSVITYVEEHRLFFEETLDAYGLWGSCASIRTAGIEPDFDGLFGNDAEAKFARLAAAGNAAIEQDRAEVLILGSTTMHEAGDYLAEHVPAPVINPGPVAIKMTESIVKLGLSHSPVGYGAPAAIQDDLWRSLKSVEH